LHNSLPNFVKIGQLFQNLKEGHIQTADLIKSTFSHLREETRVKTWVLLVVITFKAKNYCQFLCLSELLTPSLVPATNSPVSWLPLPRNSHSLF